MKNISRNIVFVLLVSCYTFVISAEQHCIPCGLPGSGKTNHLAATAKQIHPSGLRFFLKQGKSISATPGIDTPPIADLLDTTQWSIQSSQLVRIPLNIVYPAQYFCILYLPRGPTIA